MRSCWWILCGLVLFVCVGCGGSGKDIPGDGSEPPTVKLTDEEEAAERELGNTPPGKTTGRDPGSP